MSPGARIFLVIAVLWLGLWAMGSILFFVGARAMDRDADRIAAPLTELRPGADVRFEGVIDGDHLVTAPLSEQPCAAARMEIAYVTWHYDANHKVERASVPVATRLVPSTVQVIVGAQSVALPLTYWEPPASKSGDLTQAVAEIPARLNISAVEVAEAKGRARGDFIQYTLEEWRLLGGARVFIQADLVDNAGHLELAPNRERGNIAIFRGTQQEALADMHGNAHGMRIAGGVFVGLAVAPIAVFGVLQLRRRRSSARDVVGARG